MNNLKIIADDFGLHTKINEGITEALKKEWISGASIMANGEAFKDAILRQKHLNKGTVGVHLVLVEEKPISQNSLVKSLIAKNGNLHKNHQIFFMRYILGLVKYNEIEIELRAQIEKIKQHEINLGFINSHQHLHLLPKITDIVIKLAKEYNISYIRIMRQPIPNYGGVLRRLQLMLLNFLSKQAKRKIKKNNLSCNDFFVGFLSAGNLSKADINTALELSKKYPQKIVELGTHPGHENSDLKERYNPWGGYNWEKELEILSNLNVT